MRGLLYGVVGEWIAEGRSVFGVSQFCEAKSGSIVPGSYQRVLYSEA